MVPENLFGIAVAATPTRDETNTSGDSEVTSFDLHCNTISVPSDFSKDFTVLSELSFKESFRTLYEKQECYALLIETLDRVVKKQREVFKNSKYDYREVALYVGQDSRNPVPYQLLQSSIIGDETMPAGVPLSDLNVSGLQDPNNFLKSLRHLGDLLEECVWKKGGFTAPAKYFRTSDDIMFSDIKRKLDEPGLSDNERESLMEHFLGAAYFYGKTIGKSLNLNNHMFAISLPKGYQTNLELQERFPSLGAFTLWHPDARESFNRGFNDTYKGKRYKKFKFAIDDPKPFFTDPCADIVREQFQVVRGERLASEVDDDTEFRKSIIKSCKAIKDTIPPESLVLLT